MLKASQPLVGGWGLSERYPWTTPHPATRSRRNRSAPVAEFARIWRTRAAKDPKNPSAKPHHVQTPREIRETQEGDLNHLASFPFSLQKAQGSTQRRKDAKLSKHLALLVTSRLSTRMRQPFTHKEPRTKPPTTFLSPFQFLQSPSSKRQPLAWRRIAASSPELADTLSAEPSFLGVGRWQ